MKKALLYVRVSSKEQEKEGYSLDAQEKLGREYAKRNGLEIVRIWKVSESAWRQERSAFNQLIDYSKKHPEIEHIIFDITDRMTRNDFDKLKVYTLIKEYGKTIHFSRTNKTINKDSGSDDEFMFDIEVAVAKKMSNDISRKASMGMLEKAEQGEYPSTAPIGYLNDKQTGLIEIDPERAPFVKMAFQEMASGNYSLSTLSDKLYKEGLRSKKGLRLFKATLAHFLKNPFYYGSFLWKGKLYAGTHEPLITKKLFDQAQCVLSGRGHSICVNENGFLFNNLLKCGICGCKVLGEKKKGKYIYYHCTFSKGRHKSNYSYVREDRLAMLFEDSVRRVTLSKEQCESVKDILNESRSDQVQIQEKKMSALITRKVKLENRLSNLYDLRIDGNIDDDMFKQKENEYKDQLIEVKSAINEGQKTNPNFFEDGCKILELSNRLFPLYLRSDGEDKARILRLLASNYLLDGSTISATYNKPFCFLENLPDRIIKLPRQDSNLRPAD